MRLKQLGANVGFLEEIARRCPFPINEGTSLEAQTWILVETVRREIELSQIYDGLRSLGDRQLLLHGTSIRSHQAETGIAFHSFVDLEFALEQTRLTSGRLPIA